MAQDSQLITTPDLSTKEEEEDTMVVMEVTVEVKVVTLVAREATQLVAIRQLSFKVEGVGEEDMEGEAVLVSELDCC